MTDYPYVTTPSGVVHLTCCPKLRRDAIRWRWSPRNDAPGVNTACRVCLGGVLPEEVS